MSQSTLVEVPLLVYPASLITKNGVGLLVPVDLHAQTLARWRFECWLDVAGDRVRPEFAGHQPHICA